MAAARKDEQTSPWGTLARLLERVTASESRAEALLSAALTSSRLPSLPTAPAEVVAFARNHLFDTLKAELGPRLATAFLRDLATQLDCKIPIAPAEAPRRKDTLPSPTMPRSTAPPRKKLPSITGEAGRPLVLVHEPDALQRASLGRALVVEGFDVRSSESVAELVDLLGNVGGVLLVVIEPGEDGAALHALAAAPVALPLVIRSRRAKTAAKAARELGRSVLRVFDTTDPLRDVVACLREAADTPALEHHESFERISPEALKRVPHLAVGREDAAWFALEPGTSAVLDQVDGVADLGTIGRKCGLSGADVLKIAESLVEQGIVTLH
jgi:hypothetical protein